MRQSPHRVRNFEALQHWPRGGIQAIAANFLARKLGAIQQQRAHPARRADRRAGRSRRTRPNNRNIVEHVE
jgi:hypothetical protein